MAYQALYDLSSSHLFQMDRQMGKVAVQEKTFPNRLLQKPTIIKYKMIKHKHKSSKISTYMHIAD